jgi:hypothetical protein
MLHHRCNQRCTFKKCARARDKRGVDLISDALPFGRLWYQDARGGLISCDQISMTAPYLKLQ